MKPFFEKLFAFDSKKHTIRTEILAGLTTFLTMAYILAVNPSIPYSKAASYSERKSLPHL